MDRVTDRRFKHSRFCLFVGLSVCISICLDVRSSNCHPYACLPNCQIVCLFVLPTYVHSFFCLPVFLSVHRAVCISAWLSLCLYAYQPIFLFNNLSCNLAGKWSTVGYLWKWDIFIRNLTIQILNNISPWNPARQVVCLFICLFFFM